MVNSLARSQGAITSKLSGGLAFLATVGSTAPFVGLFGTVIGIIRALIRIGAAGQASIDAVAGPVGEALIMTAIGLVVAVPAVMQYNWLMRRNKSIGEELARFANHIHGYLISGGTVRPTVAAPRAAGVPPGSGIVGRFDRRREHVQAVRKESAGPRPRRPLSGAAAWAAPNQNRKSYYGNAGRRIRRRRRHTDVRHQHDASRGRHAGHADHLPHHRAGRAAIGAGAAAEGGI